VRNVSECGAAISFPKLRSLLEGSNTAVVQLIWLASAISQWSTVMEPPSVAIHHEGKQAVQRSATFVRRMPAFGWTSPEVRSPVGGRNRLIRLAS
jgi:hypothetical protein